MNEANRTTSASSELLKPQESNQETISTPSESDGESDLPSSEPSEPKSPLEQVKDLLADAGDQAFEEQPEPVAASESGEGEREATASPEPDPSSPATLKEFAESNGFDVKDLYGLNVPLPGSDGESVTVGELKDFVPKFKEAEQELAQEFQSLNQQKTELIAAQRELNQLHQESGVEITPERLEHVRQLRATHLETERRRFITAVPELADPEHMNAWQQELAEYLPKYGVDPSEIVIEDSRVAVLLHRLLSVEKQLNKLASFKPEKAKPKQAVSKSRQSPGASNLDRMMQHARQGTERDKIRAVSKLLGG